jgi:secernin
VCDTLCVQTPDGMLFAKNSDRHPDEAQVFEWHARRAAGAALRTQYLTIDDVASYAFGGSRPTWLWGVEHGVNEHRVAIGNEKIWTTDQPGNLPVALIGMDLVRLGLERARDANEAVDVITSLLERHGQGGSGEPHQVEPYFSSFLVADPQDGWIIETSDRSWAARPVGAGAAISNRISLTTDWTRASADVTPGRSFDDFRLPAMPTGVADHRLVRTREAVGCGHATSVAALARVMRSHGPSDDAPIPVAVGDDWEGFTVCMHRADLHAQTTASMIAELRDDERMRMWICLGNPCVSVYVPQFPSGAAPELAEAATWSRFARLRDRAEASQDEYDAIRAALAPVERGLWAEADEWFSRGDEDRLRQFAVNAFAPVDDVLHRLGV